MIRKIYDYFYNMNFYKFMFFVQTIALILMFAFCSPIPSSAASQQTYFPFVQNNDNIPANVYGAVTSSYPLDDYYVFISYTSWWNTNYPYFAISKQYAYPYANISQDGYHFSFYNGSAGYYGECRIQSNGNLTINSGLNISYNPYYQNLVSPIYDSSISYFMNFDLYTDSSEVVPVAFVTAPITVPTGGDPSAFDDTGLNLDSSIASSTPPTVPSTYVPTLPSVPTWDSSQPVQSIWDYLTYGFDVLSTLLQGMISKFVEWFNYFKSLVGYVIQKILNYLKAIVEWLYNQFLDWLTPYLKIIEFIGGVLFDEENQKSIIDILGEIKDSILDYVNTYFPPDYSPITDKIEDFMTAFNSLKNLFTADPDYSFVYNTFIGTYLGQ